MRALIAVARFKPSFVFLQEAESQDYEMRARFSCVVRFHFLDDGILHWCSSRWMGYALLGETFAKVSNIA